MASFASPGRKCSNFLKTRRTFASNIGKKHCPLPTDVSMLADSVPVKQPKRCGAQGRLMRFLFRIAFWLTLVVLLLPSAGSHTSSNGLLSATEAMSAAKATVTDARSFCDRQPEACLIGSQAAVAIGHRAQVGIKMVYDYLTEHLGAEDGGAGAASAKATAQSSRASHDTLVPADLVQPWRGPRPRKEARLDRPQ